MIRERRRNLRIKERHKVRMTVKSLPEDTPAGKTYFVGWTEDMSIGGLRLTSHGQLPVGAGLKLRIECTHPQETYDIGGRVMWCVEDGDVNATRVGIYIEESPREAFLTWSRMVVRRAE